MNKKRLGDKGVPCVNLHDGRTIRYPDPLISEHDSVMVDIATNKITEFIKYDAGALVMLTGGRNAGRVGVITRREKHKGSFEVVHVKDASGHEFATRAVTIQLLDRLTCPNDDAHYEAAVAALGPVLSDLYAQKHEVVRAHADDPRKPLTLVASAPDAGEAALLAKRLGG